MSAADTWTVTNTGFDANSLAQHNSAFAISNGYLGLTGNLAEDRGGRQPVTLINGVYDELDMFSRIRPSTRERRYLDPACFDGAGKSPAVANLPNPLFVRLYVGHHEVFLTGGEVSGFTQSLDLSGGVYSYNFDFRDAADRLTRVAAMRFASALHPHRVYMRYSVTPMNHDAPVRILSGIDGSVRSNVTSEQQFTVIGKDADRARRCLLHARTPVRGTGVTIGVESVCVDRTKPVAVRGLVEHDAVYTLFEFEPTANQPIVIERYVALACSEDRRHGVETDVEDELDAAADLGFSRAADEQRGQWSQRWDQADVQIDGDDRAQRYLRFCLFHLLAAAPRHTDKLSVPVKLLTGEHYQGNTFYDTDLYIVPFYTFTLPEVARNCLNWRCLGLEPGRQIARNLGYQGAKLAWQAGPSGEECLGQWYRFTRTNIHVNSAAAYALMQYHQATGDEVFMHDRGIDLLVETARFLAARVLHDAERDAYDLLDVAGPDEGHCPSDNNFYTNYLAIWNLRWAAATLDGMRRQYPEAHDRAMERLQVGADEPGRWRRIAERLTLLHDPETKLYEQCRGFFQLEPLADDLLENRSEWFETVFPYQALNQPDVLMAMVLFRDEFDLDTRRANWAFYKDKSLNFSSMSFAINSIMAADLGELERAYQDFIVSAGMDLDENLTGRKDTHAGVHGTAAGGAWLAAVFGFGGVSLSDDGLRIDPNLPPHWTGLRFRLVYRGRLLAFTIDRHQIAIAHQIEPIPADRKLPPEINVSVTGQAHTLAPGASCQVRYRG
ncbi:MAG: glycoside hydrolase family 65 protein [bacterium]|nr:glycoside hydrolase family 65 protein [bacterium]